MEEEEEVEYGVKRLEPESWLHSPYGNAEELSWEIIEDCGSWYPERYLAENLIMLAGLSDDPNVVVTTRPFVWEEDLEPDEIQLQIEADIRAGKLAPYSGVEQ